MDNSTKELVVFWAEKYNHRGFFTEDPIIFPTKFAEGIKSGSHCLKDVEIAAVFAAHFAWGRRAMIVRDCERLFSHMHWRPYDYIMNGEWRNDSVSIHRTIKWSDTAAICKRISEYYSSFDSMEALSITNFRTMIYGQKEDKSAPNKKINMLRRWMVRNDGKVDLGLWKNTDPATLLIPLDVHVHDTALALGLTLRKQKDIKTVKEITSAFGEVFQGDPCKGDFALFGYGVTHPKKQR